MTADVSTAEHLDAAADRFESEWKAAPPRPSVPAHLAAYRGPDPAALGRELAALDLAYRRLAGEPSDPSDYPHLSPADRAWVGKTADRTAPAPVPPSIGKYRVTGKVAGGGQAEVFRAVQPGLNRPVVLKWARPGPAARADLLVREARLLAALDHPNLVRVVEVDEHLGRAVVVLEEVAGVTLGEHTGGRPVAPQRAAELVAGAARGVAAAHAAGVSHLDLKPGNVLVDAAGRPRVIDFGLARDAGWLAADELPAAGGTPAFLAPEQAAGDEAALGPRTDVFGLGGLLYFLLVGRPLYAGAGRAELLRRADLAEFDPAPLRAAPARLRRVCLKALSRDPADRYPDAGAFADAVDRAVRRRRWPWAAAAAGLAGLGVFAATRPPAAPPAPLVEVRAGKGLVPLVAALPITAGELIQVRTRVPANRSVSLLLVNGRGHLTDVVGYPAGSAERVEVFPEPGRASELSGPAGTELVLACERAGPPLTLPEASALWDARADWPALPREAAVRVTADGARVVGEGTRDFSRVGVPVSDPAEAVRGRLDAFRGRLAAAGVGRLDGVAFGHP